MRDGAAACAKRRFGDYELLAEIGQGGMGVVWRARQLSLKRDVALKLVASGEFAAQAAIQRFRAEAEAAASLDHPHIVPVYDVGQHDSRHFFAMKLVEGSNLQSRLQDFARDPNLTASLVATIARAVHHAHQHGVLHRDLKPSNILLDDDGRPYVTDFGLAKRFDHDSGLTISEAVLGTPSYMAPEQARGGSKYATVAADVYGLGAILYAMLTGLPPFEADTRLETLRRVQEQEPSSIRTTNPRVSRDLETICLTCLAKDPRQRYTSSEALAEDLERWLAGKPVHVRRTSLAGRLWRWSRRRPATAALVGVVIIATVLLGAGGIWHVTRLGRALAETNEQHARARAVTAFLQDVLEMGSPGRAHGKRLTIEEALDDASRLAGEKFAGQPLTEAEVRAIIGAVYLELAKFDPAAEQHGAALKLRRAALGEDHPDTLTSRHLLGDALWRAQFPREARVHVQKAFAGRQRVFGDQHPDTVSSMHLLGNTCHGRSDYDEAEKLHREVLATRRRTLGESHADTVRSMGDLARDLAGQRRHAEAARLYEAAIQGLRHDPQQVDDALRFMINFSLTLEGLERHAEAEQLLRQVLEARTANLTAEHMFTLQAKTYLGWFLIRRGGDRLADAQRVFEELLDVRQRTLGDLHVDTQATRGYLADVLEKRGDTAGALALRLKMMELERRDRAVAPPPPPRAQRHALDASSPVELLDKVDLRRHVVRGQWRAGEGGVAVEPSFFARLAIPVHVNGSYQLTISFTRTDGDGMPVVLIPVGRGSAQFCVADGRSHFLVRDIWLSPRNATARAGRIENNRQHVLDVTVKLHGEDASIEASLDGVACITPWSGPQAALLVPRWGSLPAGATLGLGSYHAETAFHSVKLRMLDGGAEVVEFDPKLWTDPWPHVDDP